MWRGMRKFGNEHQKKGVKYMKKVTRKATLKGIAATALAASMLIGAAVLPQAQAAGYQASSIQKLEGLEVDYSQYLDSSVFMPLTDKISSTDEISVIITLDAQCLMEAYEQTDKAMSFGDYATTSPEAQALKQTISHKKAQYLEVLEAKGINYTLGEDYSALFAGFEILIQAADYEASCMSLTDGARAIVGEEYHVAETQLVENAVNVYTQTGIFNSEGAGYDGTGMVVAVLDTGLDSKHTAFSVDNFTSDHLGMTYSDVAAVLNETKAQELNGSLSVDDVYINEKVPFGYDYADNDPDVYSTHNNHGTHVSGVIVGKDDVITGVAPNAQLVSMKIFSDVMDTARSSWILSALEDCAILGVDVVNMSLGTACGFSHETEEELLSGVYQKLRDAGVCVVAAASNSFSSAYGSEANGNLPLTSNPDTATVGSPSTYQGVLSVASIDGEETPYIKYGDTIMYFDEANTAAGEERDFFGTLLGDSQSMEFEYVLVPGVGRSADYTGLDMTGKIALVRRGDNTFEEKAIIAEAQGAAGIIIYNNVSGEIKMNVGDATLAVCSISQNDGEVLAAAGSGKLTISAEQTSGPFINDFSSWGPGPSLEIKPEITAHGGKILSSVTGGGYDRLSGTSMACPNLAGVVVLLRQYVVENFPEIADDPIQVSALVNRLMMSTADIALNTNGLPYSVRKQGAGLANLMSSINTPACIITYKDGTIMDTSKLELGDDPEKTGVYTMEFAVSNFGDQELSYNIGAHVFTEGVSETKTNAGKTTVTEEAYVLSGAQITVDSVTGGSINGMKLSVPAGKEATVKLTVTLSDADKAYLDASFANGMYVEGYVTLDAVGGTQIDLNVPYLAFYGDWTVAPMFDLTYFDTNPDEMDEGINEEDKLKADAYATRLIGGVYDDFVSYLGSYYFLQDSADMDIPANKQYISLSNQVGSIHSLRFVWAGMLRNASEVKITITDDTTGEVIFETVDDYVRKSYGDGGSIYPANIEVEFDTIDYNLPNNSKYTVKVAGTLDYGNGGLDTNLNNVMEFPLTVDFEAPSITDVEYYYEYDKNAEKNRLYAKVGIYDNHYAMCAQLGYVGTGSDENGNEVPELKQFEQYMTPVYSQEDSVTYVTFELTDYIYDIKEGAMNKNTIALTVYDYALNLATYEIGLPAEYVDFYFDGLEGTVKLSPNEVYSLEPLVYPEDGWSELLEFASSKTSVARVVNNKLVAVAPGNTVIRVRDPESGKSATFNVTVLAEGDEGYRRYDKPVADIFSLDGYTTQKAYYVIDSEDKEIGDTGDKRFFEGKYDLSLYPSEAVLLNYSLDAYFPKETTVEFSSSNENIVTINEYGLVTGVAEGFASVTMKVLQDGRSTYYSETVSVEVKDPFLTTGASLTHYYGLGGVVTIPEDLDLQEIGNFAFANFDYVLKTEEELAFDDAETSKQWYIGEATVTKVIIPEGVEKIGAYAFANLTALEEVVLPSTLEAIEYGAFLGCTSLERITFSGENNLKIINQNAFENCNLQKTVDLSAACVISDYAFAGNQELEKVITSDSLLSISEYAFAGCKDLEEVVITAPKVKYGTYAFTGCESLESFYVNASVLPEGMFYECENLTKVTIGPDVNEIGPFAFRDTKVDTYEVAQGNKAYQVKTGPYILSADGTQVVAVSAVAKGAFTAADLGGTQVTGIAKGAFSHNTDITSVELPKVTTIGAYGMGSSEDITQVKLGKLTQIGEYAFFETSISQMPDMASDAVLSRYAFAYTDLVSVTIPSGMTVGEGAFAQCHSLAEVTIGDDVILEDYAFNMDKDESFSLKNYDEDGEKYFYYDFSSALQQLTIGRNAKIGESAFLGHASMETVTLGAGAEIGKMAFYNCTALKEIDLSKAAAIGEYAFSGDVYYICLDESMSVPAVSADGFYIYTYHAPALTEIDLASVSEFGDYAFAYCRQLTDVKMNSSITTIAPYSFAGCIALENIDLSGITQVGEYAFIENWALTRVDLSGAEEIGDYAFVYCEVLEDVTLNPAGGKIGEGAFSYCDVLAAPKNLDCVKEIAPYAFAYTAITQIDITGAEKVDDFAFLKETLTPVTVKLGTALHTLGDNPFAMCQVAPFVQSVSTEFNGVSYDTGNATYDISDTVRIIDGSLYCDTVNGMELIIYAGSDPVDAKVAEGTVRITSHAFAGSDVQMVTLPYTVASIGHKAFYSCDQLHTVVFGSYDAPILEEEFDSTYYESLEHIPGTGDYGTYTDYDGQEVNIIGMGMNDYYMWNATDGMYSNVFYGANFVDYLGYVEDKLTMVRPANGKNYDSYIYNQYFDLTIDGAQAADKTTLAAIAAIKNIPERVSYEQRHIVEAARAAYNKIATLEQQAQVSNYPDLVSAEQRILSLTPTEETTPEDGQTEQTPTDNGWLLWALLGIAVLGGGAAGAVMLSKKNQAKAPAAETSGEAPAPAEEVQESPAEVSAEEAASDTEETE